MALESTLAIMKFALGVADRPNRRAIAESHLADTLIDGMPVRAGIAVYGSPHRPWNAGHGLDALQSVVDRIVYQRLQLRTRLGAHADAVARYSVRGETQ